MFMYVGLFYVCKYTYIGLFFVCRIRICIRKNTVCMHACIRKRIPLRSGEPAETDTHTHTRTLRNTHKKELLETHAHANTHSEPHTHTHTNIEIFVSTQNTSLQTISLSHALASVRALANNLSFYYNLSLKLMFSSIFLCMLRMYPACI